MKIQAIIVHMGRSTMGSKLILDVINQEDLLEQMGIEDYEEHGGSIVDMIAGKGHVVLFADENECVFAKEGCMSFDEMHELFAKHTKDMYGDQAWTDSIGLVMEKLQNVQVGQLYVSLD